MANFDLTDPETTLSASAGGSSPQSSPSCASTSIVSTAKSPDATSYWPCSRCGEVWNPAGLTNELAQRRRR